MWYILSYVLDFLKLYVIETGIFGYKSKLTLKTPIIAAILTAVYIITYAFLKENEQLLAIAELLYLMTTVFAVSTAIEGKKKLLISIVSYLCVQLLDDSFTMMVSNITKIPRSDLADNIRIHYTLMLITLFIYIVITRIVLWQKKKNSQEKVDIRDSDSRYFLILAFCITGVYIMGAKQHDFFSFIIIGVIILALLVVVIQNNASKKYYENSSHIQGKIMDSQKNYYEEMLSREQETRKFRHDINNHMLCIRSLINSGQYSEAEEYISDIDAKISTLKKKYSTGNDLVNAIVNDISSRYEDVTLNWNGLLPEQMSISNMEICIIFSNLLDNAFCAASKCRDKGNVDVSIKTVTNSLFFTVRNDISEPVTTKDSKLITSKPDKKNHGFGTMNVKECVSVIGGSVDYKFSDTDFSVDVVLPNVIQ